MVTKSPPKSPQKPSSSRTRPSNHQTLLMTLAMLDMIPKVGKVSAVQMHARLLEMGFVRDLRSIQRQLEELSSQFWIERDDSSKHQLLWKRKLGADCEGFFKGGATRLYDTQRDIVGVDLSFSGGRDSEGS